MKLERRPRAPRLPAALACERARGPVLGPAPSSPPCLGRGGVRPEAVAPPASACRASLGVDRLRAAARPQSFPDVSPAPSQPPPPLTAASSRVADRPPPHGRVPQDPLAQPGEVRRLLGPAPRSPSPAWRGAVIEVTLLQL